MAKPCHLKLDILDMDGECNIRSCRQDLSSLDSNRLGQILVQAQLEELPDNFMLL